MEKGEQMEFLNSPIIVRETFPYDEVILAGIVTKPIIVGHGEKITPFEMIMRSIDWEETCKHSFMIIRIAKEHNES